MTYETIPLKFGMTAIYITREESETDDYDDEEVW